MTSFFLSTFLLAQGAWADCMDTFCAAVTFKTNKCTVVDKLPTKLDNHHGPFPYSGFELKATITDINRFPCEKWQNKKNRKEGLKELTSAHKKNIKKSRLFYCKKKEQKVTYKVGPQDWNGFDKIHLIFGQPAGKLLDAAMMEVFETTGVDVGMRIKLPKFPDKSLYHYHPKSLSKDKEKFLPIAKVAKVTIEDLPLFAVELLYSEKSKNFSKYGKKKLISEFKRFYRNKLKELTAQTADFMAKIDSGDIWTKANDQISKEMWILKNTVKPAQGINFDKLIAQRYTKYFIDEVKKTMGSLVLYELDPKGNLIGFTASLVKAKQKPFFEKAFRQAITKDSSYDESKINYFQILDGEVLVSTILTVKPGSFQKKELANSFSSKHCPEKSDIADCEKELVGKEVTKFIDDPCCDTGESSGKCLTGISVLEELPQFN